MISRTKFVHIRAPFFSIRGSIFILLGLLFEFSIAEDSEKKITIALIGDSTVTDTAGWGAAFAKRFSPHVTVHNFSAGGRSAKSWLAEDRLPAALAVKPDYVLIQFGHNGQPGKGPKRETDPATTYQELLKQYVKEFRAIGARPILVSSVTRRDFTGKGKIRIDQPGPDATGARATRPLKPWADAAKAVAEEVKAPFIDLYHASVTYHNRIGKAASQEFSPKEGNITHFNEAGAEAIAGLVIAGVKEDVPELAKAIRK
jgi:pectinesterase